MRPGSRTSPASLLTSHQPASEMNAEIRPTARACGSGGEPGRCAQNGVEVRPVAAARAEPPDHQEHQQPDLQAGQGAEDPRADRGARAC